jgi:hypothetical protein
LGGHKNLISKGWWRSAFAPRPSLARPADGRNGG